MLCYQGNPNSNNMKYHCGAIRMGNIQTMTTSNAGKNVEKQNLTAGGNAKWYSHLGKEIGNFLQN
jgi:hypothetical protein